MSLYRNKLAGVEAMQIPDHLDRHGWFMIEEWLKRAVRYLRIQNRTQITIPTLEGEMTGKSGDWIIKGAEGEIYPCRDSIFRATYELADAEGQ